MPFESGLEEAFVVLAEVVSGQDHRHPGLYVPHRPEFDILQGHLHIQSLSVEVGLLRDGGPDSGLVHNLVDLLLFFALFTLIGFLLFQGIRNHVSDEQLLQVRTVVALGYKLAVVLDPVGLLRVVDQFEEVGLPLEVAFERVHQLSGLNPLLLVSDLRLLLQELPVLALCLSLLL